MPSFRRKPDNRRQVYLSLVSSIEGQLRDAYAKRFDAGEDNQVTIANKLGIHRSAVNRRLSGGLNMTVKSIADLVWSLGYCAEFTMFDPREVSTNKNIVIPVHPASPSPPAVLVGDWKKILTRPATTTTTINANIKTELAS